MIKQDAFAKHVFIGVYARDQIPLIKKYPCCIILNTDVSTKPGEHWLAIYYIDKNNLEFFDSFGHAPSYFQLVFKNQNVVYNKKQIQDYSSFFCGYYATTYILFRSRDYSLTIFVNFFSDDTLKNDKEIEKLIKIYL